MKSVIVGIAIALTGVAVYSFTSAKKIAFIDTNEVFSQFKMTDKSEVELNRIASGKKAILDSLELNIKRIQHSTANQEEIKYKKLDYLKKRDQFNQEIERIKASSIEKVWKQINLYISEYGKEKRYDIILGANGQGSLMYARESIDITKDIILYANEKYQGN